MTLASAHGISLDELQLAARNHGFPVELVREPITPLGLHYLLIHWDIPHVDAGTWRLTVGGLVANELSLSLDDLRSRPATTLPVTLECAGNGRALMPQHDASQPWLADAVGTAEWTGTPLAPLLEEAGIASGAHEVVFTGLDRGIQGDVEHDYERSLVLADARRPEVLLAYEMNGIPLPVQHGYPLRLIVPGWYGMTSVKWLRAITVIGDEFKGWQQQEAYRIDGVPVTRIVPRSLLAPPGIADFMTRRRVLDAGPCDLVGRAWSGWGQVSRVEVSVDGGGAWVDAELDPPLGEHAWRGFRHRWDAAPGEYELCCRATDAAGNAQPLEPPSNSGGYSNNAVQRVHVTVPR